MPTRCSISNGPLAGFFLGDTLLMDQNSFHNLVADGMQRAEGGHRFLEDHPDLLAADAAHLFAARRQVKHIDNLGL